MGFTRHLRMAEFFRRQLAAVCAMLVFALGVFAASPGLHEQLHHGPQASPDDGCAVVLFANGVSASLAVIDLPPVPVAWGAQIFAGSPELLLGSPCYRLLPGRGPPVG